MGRILKIDMNTTKAKSPDKRVIGLFCFKGDT